MILKTFLLAGFLFAAIYPLCFWLHVYMPLKGKFHKYHLRITNFVSGATVIITIFLGLSPWIKIVMLIWKVVLLRVSIIYWKQKYPNLFILSGVSLLGIINFTLIQIAWKPVGIGVFILELILGSAICFGIFYRLRHCEYASAHTAHKRK